MTHLHGPSCDDEADILAFPRPYSTSEQMRDLAGDSDLDVLMKKYEAEAQRMYDDRTAGDHSWMGLLASFAFELAAAR